MIATQFVFGISSRSYSGRELQMVKIPLREGEEGVTKLTDQHTSRAGRRRRRLSTHTLRMLHLIVPVDQSSGAAGP